VNLNSVESVKIIQFNDLGSLLSGPYLTAYMPLGGSNSRCVSAENYAISTQDDDNYYWSGVGTDRPLVIELKKDSTGYAGYVGLVESDEDRIYDFIPITSDISALVKYDTAFMHRMICADTMTIEADTTGNGLVSDLEVSTRGSCGTSNIRVLFLFTELASNTGVNLMSVAERTIDQLNTSTLGSGLGRNVIRFELAGLKPIDITEGIGTIAQDVANLTLNPDAIDAREDAYADVVVLLTDDVYGNTVGRAKGIGIVGYNAYCIAVVNAAAAFFTAAHEIGHLIGARHQKCSTCNISGCDIFTKNHGFPIGDNLRTIMYQQIPADELENCGHRMRVGAWSSETALFLGQATGNANNRNAHKLQLRGGIVACFEDDPPSPTPSSLIPLPIGINGPTSITSCGPTSSTWTATPSAGSLTTPIHYIWDWSPHGVDDWTVLGTTASITINHSSLPTSWFVLRLTVTDGSPGFGDESIAIKYSHCEPGEQTDLHTKLEWRSEYNNLDLQVYPNPTNQFITINSKQLVEIKNIVLIDSFGKEKTLPSELTTDETLTINLESMASGFYYLYVTGINGSTEIFKVVKI
jgi:hypothetical protein